MDRRQGTDKVTIGRAVEILQQEFPDVSVSSLRFLEREGLIRAERKPGGHRVYSQQALDSIRQIKRWQADRIPLKDIRDRMERAPASDDFGPIVASMTESLLINNIPGAMSLLWDVQRSGTPLLDICDSILTPVLSNMGDANGGHLIPVDVQMELDQQLISFLSIAEPKSGQLSNQPVIVAACPPWERHDIPLRMLTVLLRERGAGVHYIGAMVDADFLADAIRRIRPQTVLVSLTVEPPATAARWFSDVSSALVPSPRIVAGGSGSAHLSERYAEDLFVLGTQSFAETLQQLLPDRN